MLVRLQYLTAIDGLMLARNSQVHEDSVPERERGHLGGPVLLKFRPCQCFTKERTIRFPSAMRTCNR